MSKTTLVAVSALAVLMAAQTARADEAREIRAAFAWAKPVLGSSCDFASAEGVDDFGGSRVYDIRYRYKGQDQDEQDQVFRLIQLFCMSGAYNVSFVFLAAGMEAGDYKLLSFAEPKADYDYTDESFTKLAAPPRVSGFVSRGELVNADFDPKTGVLSSDAKWRGLGDAWSHGEWRFIEGEFVLARFEIDPIYDLNRDDAQQPDPDPQPESYVIYQPQEP
ncbi:hypothetical protein M2360_002600 [Rhizobium sp. SG_E_25_P2]|uniref:DUF1176 domain-containing protein n=1 Tax=Rhizobium sp. SG_E_25_P2 TaxID=2879942 RepID=UPI0024741A91|nr:DUF1176 domain-containing protein [Rhizobium sp. SG_E_25_P2]MDH6267203.1 hypothetical protein [Rhizobium sp. SG_E_25_P2]